MNLLPTELIEKIAPFIQDEGDLKKWLECFKTLRNFGDLMLIMDLDKREICTQLKF